ncbi:MAG: hypothetical protein ACRD2T_08240 [Thermoanaerobaculia bacterium]
MTSRPYAALGLTLALALPAVARGQGFYLVGSVGLEKREGIVQTYRLDSAADVVCYNWLGYYADNCQISGEHYVYDSNSNEHIADYGYVSWGNFAHYMQAFGDGGHCYRARLTTVISGTNTSNAWGSAQRCFVDPTPVLLDLDLDGFHLSGPDQAVHFDLDADGVAEALAWTAPSARDAFLCLDRDGNGVIGDGRELFGAMTPLLSGAPAQIGYEALAELDRSELGGDGDGTVGPEDAAFDRLCAWVDTNHDGISQPAEVLSLAAAGVTRLGFDYVAEERRDPHGNLFRYRAASWHLSPAGNERAASSYDVILATP